MRESPLPPIAASIDLDRYPIAPLAGEPALALAKHCRAQLAAKGSCLLPGVLTAGAVATMAAEAVAIPPLAHRKVGGRGRTAYLAPAAEGFPHAHPPRRMQPSSPGAAA